MAPSATTTTRTTAQNNVSSKKYDLVSPTSTTTTASSKTRTSSKNGRRSLQGLVKSFRRSKSKRKNVGGVNNSDNLSTDTSTTPATIEIEIVPPVVDKNSMISEDDDDESVVDAAAERSSTTTTTTAPEATASAAASKDVAVIAVEEEEDTDTAENKKKKKPLDLVVLLMHPVSHRFELVQLEFVDAEKAKVSDLLGQIPVSVTEECLKSQLYDSILDQDSTDPGRRPRVEGSTKLVEAFGAGGGGGSGENDDDDDVDRKMLLVARPQGISDLDALKMARPIFMNKDILSMLELSGFDVSSWKNKKFALGGGGGGGDPIASEKKEPEAKEAVVRRDASPARNSLASYALLGLVVAMIVAQLLHSNLSKPLEAGFVLKPGSFASRCGLAGYAPFSAAKGLLFPGMTTCEDEFLRVNLDGTATLLDADRRPVMVLKGGVCDEVPNCVDGLVMNADDGSLFLGWRRVKQVLVRDKSQRNRKLTPWPFASEPTNLRYKIGPKTAFEGEQQQQQQQP